MNSPIITNPNAPLTDTAGPQLDPQKQARVKALIALLSPVLDAHSKHGGDISEALAALLSMVESGTKTAPNPAMPALMAGYLRGLADHLDEVMRGRVALAAAPAGNTRPL